MKSVVVFVLKPCSVMPLIRALVRRRGSTADQVRTTSAIVDDLGHGPLADVAAGQPFGLRRNQDQVGSVPGEVLGRVSRLQPSGSDAEVAVVEQQLPEVSCRDRGLCHIRVFMAGARMTGLEKSQARNRQVRKLSQRPSANLASVLASSGATMSRSAQLRNSMWSTGSPRR